MSKFTIKHLHTNQYFEQKLAKHSKYYSTIVYLGKPPPTYTHES